jgi:hypothetical protein
VKVQLDYLRAVTDRTKQYLASLAPAELDRELDESWQQPRPTVAVRIVSILADCHQHAGEASYIRGLLEAKAKSTRSATRKRQARPAGRKAARKKRSR